MTTNNLHRLVYTSVRKPNCTDEEIRKILASCEKNNPGKNITGVLLHSDKRFIQYIEGDGETIRNLYDHIEDDPRHAGVNLRSFEQIPERKFGSWHMGYKDVSKEKLGFDTNISREDFQAFDQLIEGSYNINDRSLRLLQMFFEMS